MERLRFITAASLFDGHDVSINIMRRLLQSEGVEVIHLGHNRSAKEIVDAAIQEDVHAIALSSYQGGHNEYFLYIRQLLDEAGAKAIKIFGGGGGVITPHEISHLESSGIERVYSPRDGVELGLIGIIKDMTQRSSLSTIKDINFKDFSKRKLSNYEISKVVSFIENNGELPFKCSEKVIPVLGITGTGGAGKSSLIDELLIRFSLQLPELKIALISVDPTRKKNQGALLGDRIRIGRTAHQKYFIRSLATRNSNTELSPEISKVVSFLKSQNFNLIVVETSGIGQASDEITKISDSCMYVMTPDYGAQSQLEKIEMLDSADFIALNKFEKPRAEDALRDIRKQYRRNKNLFSDHPDALKDTELPIFGTMASRFNDAGVHQLFNAIVTKMNLLSKSPYPIEVSPKKMINIISAERTLYLRDIAQTIKKYNSDVEEVASRLELIDAIENLQKQEKNNKEITSLYNLQKKGIDQQVYSEIEDFDLSVSTYRGDKSTKYESLSGLLISKVGLPKLKSLADKYRFIKLKNIPGKFPYTAGIFPFKRADEDPKRMFAGEGGPERTNKRFHYLSKDDTAKRLSTAFDSVTLYGEDPNIRPDIFGKIGEAGVSIATLDDMETLFAGFDLCDKNTSVSMTINGPAPILLAMYMNTAIKQKLQESGFLDHENRLEIMRSVRGTVQADILKEDQAQNTCIYSLEFALKMMGDVQEFFCENNINKYYTVSVSGYHIAEAGANPITQLAFTLANGFTYVEYYLSRGLDINLFARNFSFFFSNGLDPEYAVIGQVARKIWAVVMKNRYGADTKAQKFKYHIQTSGRSLHAQEIDFNDIRTTLQALLALSDNCNSLHTNAYDEAITTPTEDSVRRAMAIQMIINREFGLNKTDNPMQGSYLYEELCELVEAAVLEEFERISDKGGVLGSMESMYQRSKIQEESLLYESMKDSGKLPIIGVNTYLRPNKKEELEQNLEISRCTQKEKEEQINRLNAFQARNKEFKYVKLQELENVILSGGNVFGELLNTVNYCTLGEISTLLYKVGGQYRRNM